MINISTKQIFAQYLNVFTLSIMFLFGTSVAFIVAAEQQPSAITFSTKKQTVIPPGYVPKGYRYLELVSFIVKKKNNSYHVVFQECKKCELLVKEINSNTEIRRINEKGVEAAELNSLIPEKKYEGGLGYRSQSDSVLMKLDIFE